MKIVTKLTLVMHCNYLIWQSILPLRQHTDPILYLYSEFKVLFQVEPIGQFR